MIEEQRAASVRTDDHLLTVYPPDRHQARPSGACRSEPTELEPTQRGRHHRGQRACHGGYGGAGRRAAWSSHGISPSAPGRDGFAMNTSEPGAVRGTRLSGNRAERSGEDSSDVRSPTTEPSSATSPVPTPTTASSPYAVSPTTDTTGCPATATWRSTVMSRAAEHPGDRGGQPQPRNLGDRHQHHRLSQLPRTLTSHGLRRGPQQPTTHRTTSTRDRARAPQGRPPDQTREEESSLRASGRPPPACRSSPPALLRFWKPDRPLTAHREERTQLPRGTRQTRYAGLSDLRCNWSGG